MGQMSFINSRLIEDEIFLEEVLLIRKPLALLLGENFSLVPSLLSLFFCLFLLLLFSNFSAAYLYRQLLKNAGGHVLCPFATPSN